MVSNADQDSTMVLKIERFQPEGMNVRMSDGKPSYSHVVAVSGSGKIVYTAGQLARDIDGNCVGKGDMRAQMEQTFQNLDRCLKAAGATWADVVKTTSGPQRDSAVPLERLPRGPPALSNGKSGAVCRVWEGPPLATQTLGGGHGT
jgi:Endoribonuclease L-PSP